MLLTSSNVYLYSCQSKQGKTCTLVDLKSPIATRRATRRVNAHLLCLPWLISCAARCQGAPRGTPTLLFLRAFAQLSCAPRGAPRGASTLTSSACLSLPSPVPQPLPVKTPRTTQQDIPSQDPTGPPVPHFKCKPLTESFQSTSNHIIIAALQTTHIAFNSPNCAE